MADLNSLLGEFEMESKKTRRLIERVPQEKLSWKPHEKSKSLGELAWHLAMIPERIATAASRNGNFEVRQIPQPPMPASTAEILAGFDQGAVRTTALLSALTDEQLAQPFRMQIGEKTLFEGKRGTFLHTVLIKHVVHHRGQLSVYLRLLDVPVPSIYGPSADEG